MNENRVEDVLVTNVTAANTGTSLATIAEGDLLVLNKNNANLTGTPTPTSAEGNEAIRLAVGLPSDVEDASKSFRLSGLIKSSQVLSWKKQVYQAPAQKVVTIGALVGKDNSEFRFRVVFKDRHRHMPHRPTTLDYYYSIDGTSSQTKVLEMALSFAKKANLDTRPIRGKVEVGVTSTGTLTELTANAVLTNGSRTVTSTGHGFSVGDYASFRDIIYKVAKVIDANTIELDRPYTGVSETIAVAATVDQAASFATPTASNIVVTGQAVTTRPPDLYQQTNFSANVAPINGLPGEESPEVESGLAAGNGFWEQVRDMEFFEAGRRGITNRVDFPIDKWVPIARPGNTYTLYIIEYKDEASVAHHLVKNPQSVVLAFNISGATTKAAAVEAILDSWMVGAGLPAVT